MKTHSVVCEKTLPGALAPPSVSLRLDRGNNQGMEQIRSIHFLLRSLAITHTEHMANLHV